jgi:hypothetical protein
LALLRAIDPAETDAFSAVVVQNFDGVAVEDADDLPGEVGSCQGSAQQKKDASTVAPKASSCPTSTRVLPA